MKAKTFIAACECEPKVPFKAILDRYAHTKDERVRMRRAMLAVLQTIVHHGRRAEAVARDVTTRGWTPAVKQEFPKPQSPPAGGGSNG